MRIYPGRLGAFLAIPFFFIACNKKPDQVGLGLQPAAVELSVVFDNSSGLLAHSILEDSVRTDVNVVKTGMLGSMLDPVFGKTTAEIYSQFRLSANGHDYGDTLVVLDSLVLSLSYSGFYGDTLSNQTIKIYQLTEDMNPDTSYFSNQSIAADENEIIGSKTFTPMPSDSVNVGGGMKGPQLRIRLTDEFAQKFIDADPNVYDENGAWLEFMKGFKITSEPAISDGGIMQFDMLANNSILTIYYRSGYPHDTLSFTFLSNSNCARFTAFDHNEYLDASPEFKSQVINADTSMGTELFYLQSMGGVKAQLRLPDIKAYFDDGPVAINEAKLIFKIYNDGTDLEAPPQLGLAMIDEEGDYIPLPDANEAAGYYGGYLNDAKTEYYFRISRHVQRVLTGQSPNYPLALLITGSSFRSNRLILNGTNPVMDPDMKMVLNVIYTKVN